MPSSDINGHAGSHSTGDARIDLSEQTYSSSQEDLKRLQNDSILKRIPSGAEATTVLVSNNILCYIHQLYDVYGVHAKVLFLILPNYFLILFLSFAFTFARNCFDRMQVGSVDFLGQPTGAFVRLAEAITIPGITEIPIPCR